MEQRRRESCTVTRYDVCAFDLISGCIMSEASAWRSLSLSPSSLEFTFQLRGFPYECVACTDLATPGSRCGLSTIHLVLHIMSFWLTTWTRSRLDQAIIVGFTITHKPQSNHSSGQTIPEWSEIDFQAQISSKGTEINRPTISSMKWL